MPHPLRLVVFDVDGTLIDSRAAILTGMHRAFAACGLPAPADPEILAIVGLSLPQAFAALRPDLPADRHAALAAAYRAAFVALRAETGAEAASPLFPGARAALDRLTARPGLRLGVATGKARRGLDHMLDAHGLHGRFATLQTADGHPSKPDPAMLRAALAETGAAPSQAVMVGDTDFDVIMARAAGMTAIAVSWGFHPVARLRAAGAHAVIDRFDDLDAALADLATAA